MRDIDYWQKLTGGALTTRGRAHTRLIPGASCSRRCLCGYAFAQFSSQEYAQAEFQLDQVFTVSELAYCRANGNAARALLSAAVGATTGVRTGGRVYLPYGERVIDSSTQEIFGETLQQMDNRSMMARPLDDGTTMDDVKAIFAAPGAIHWLPDEF